MKLLKETKTPLKGKMREHQSFRNMISDKFTSLSMNEFNEQIRKSIAGWQNIIYDDVFDSSRETPEIEIFICLSVNKQYFLGCSSFRSVQNVKTVILMFEHWMLRVYILLCHNTKEKIF